MKRVLLTGGSGAIGCHILAHLLEKTDWEVAVIDSFCRGSFDRLTQIYRSHRQQFDRVKIIRHDLTAPFTAREIEQLGHIDYVVNLASLVVVHESVADPVPFIRNNIELTLQVLELARRIKPEAFVQFSTDEVYGPAGPEPYEEWSPLVPSNPYAASKAAQEAIAISYWCSYGLPLVIVNSANNFGPMAGLPKFTALTQQKLTQGKPVTIHASPTGEIGSRSYIHSRNTASAVLFILQNTTPHLHEPGTADKPDRYNIVGESVDNLELAKKIASFMGKADERFEVVDQLDWLPGHDLHYSLDGTKLGRLGWVAPQSFDDSLKSSVEWHQQHPEWLA